MSGIAVTPERTFHLAPPPWRLPSEDGLVAVLDAGRAATPAHTVLDEVAYGALAWIATSEGFLPDGPASLPRVGVRVAALAPTGVGEVRVALAHQFAAHLSALRDGAGVVVGQCLTSAVRPTPPPDAVRIPHLAAIDQGDQTADTVVWELMTRDNAGVWLGGMLPDQGFFEAHLSLLLALRAAVRAHCAPAGEAGRRLTTLLRHRYLSIRLVYQHPEVFRVLLSDLEKVTANDDQLLGRH
ncbi:MULTISPECIES: hypothetical protein [unclassified Frankia]|uniref:hypothetical protein n=1 Tax=unclassified Frankia TaxID=2632575 RepID=UPI001EF5EC1B|nr:MULTISPECIES: hypothetical protein [unclassified Frankia]